MFEADLFQLDLYDASNSLLDHYVQQGIVFLTTKQVMQILNKTYGQIRYAILNYELDAFYLFGDYRITASAIRDYQEKGQEEYERPYHSVMLRLELDGVYELANGSDLRPIKKSLDLQKMPYTVIDDLIHKSKHYHYDQEYEGYTEKNDFYDIPSLAIPDKILLGSLAELLNISAEKLKSYFGTSDNFHELSFTDVYDLLVESEVVNMNIPLKNEGSQKIFNMDGQLNLF